MVHQLFQEVIGVATQIGVTKGPLQGWMRQENDLKLSRKGSRHVQTKVTFENSEVNKSGIWSRMELQLNTEFLAARADGKPVGKKWFIRQGKMSYSNVYSEEMDIDPISNRRTFSRCKLEILQWLV